MPRYVFIALYSSLVLSNVMVLSAMAENLAINASYTLDPLPEYKLTQNTNDMTDLTDGIYVEKRMWSSKKAVGWRETGLIEIEIDLKSDYTISDVCFNSARDENADVFFPARVEVFVSSDRKNYLRVGDIYQGKKPGNGSYQVKKFCMNDISNYGRYVLLVVVPSGKFKFTFLDEVEVYGNKDSRNSKVENSETKKKNEIGKFVISTNRMQNDKIAIRKKFKNLQINSSYEIKLKIDTVIAGIDSVINPSENQIKKYENDLLAITKEKNTETIEKKLYIWKKNPWTNVNSLFPPDLTKDSIALNFELFDGISASDAIILTNYLDVDLTYEISMNWLAAKINAPNVEISNVVNVITSEYQEVGDALVPYQGESIIIKAGEAKQIWITVSNVEGGYGAYVGSIKLQSLANPAYNRQIPIEAKVFSVSTVHQEIYVNAWAYLNHPLITNQPAMAAKDIAKHHVNVSVLHPSDVPWPVLSKDGSFTVNYTSSDNNFSYQKNMRKKLLFLNFKNESLRSFNSQSEFMSESWKKIFSNWLQDWVVHLKMQGLAYDDFAFYPLDEPMNSDEVEILLDTARLIKTIDPQIDIYTTLGKMDSLDIMVAKNLIDIYQVHVDDLLDLRITTLKELNKQIWIYSTSGGKSASPLEYYRSQAWKTFQVGATGMGFWAYADIGWSDGSAWDDFDGKVPDYAVIYEANNYIVSSKRWEAWKAGVEDYRLLTMYKQVTSQEEITELVTWVLEGGEVENRYDTARAKMIKKLAVPLKPSNLNIKQ